MLQGLIDVKLIHVKISIFSILIHLKFFDANNIYKEQSESLFWPFTNYRALPEEELRSPKHPENISGRTHKAGSMLVNTWANMYGPHNPTFTAPSFNERIMVSTVEFDLNSIEAISYLGLMKSQLNAKM